MESINNAGNLTYITEVLENIQTTIKYNDDYEKRKLGLYIELHLGGSTRTMEVCLFEYSGGLNINGGIVKEGKYPHQLTEKAKEYFDKWLELKKIEFLNYIKTA